MKILKVNDEIPLITSWWIEGKGSTLVLLVVEGLPQVVLPQFAKINSTLFVYEKDIKIKEITIEAIDTLYNITCASTEQYLIILLNGGNRKLHSVNLEWDQLKSLESIPKSAVHTFHTTERSFPKFFSLGNQLHAFDAEDFFERQWGHWNCVTLSNVLKNGRIELNELNKERIEISDDNIQQATWLKPISTVYGNFILCQGENSQTKFCFLVEIKNRGDQSQK